MRIGFIGLGTMGGPMALNIRKAGFEMTVHDLNRQAARALEAAGAVWAESARAVADASDVVLTSLPGPPEVETVAPELLAGFERGKVWFDLTTNSPVLVRRLHPAFAAIGAALFDAPVSGGPRGAQSGKLAVLVGGDKAVFEAHRAPLDAMGDQVRHVGPLGAGAVTKLVHNASGYAMQCAIVEMFTAGVKAGVEPLALWEAIRQGVRGRQRSFDSLADHFLPGDYDPPDFALRLAHKDVALAAELGRDMGVPMRLIDLTRAEMSEALARGWGERDSRAFLLLQQERAGVEIQVSKAAIDAVLKADDGG
ncbi:MAG: NAD(P)-dependent oxidoreductase [Alphaproteobacteria bacterium]|nr:NAD(P)-dependent oxidoreductase [Alphaproteobacteria bacterium]MCY4231526.1 NAD(P)-dependent oxidoreductase [Alphaproteobacteria bacterium]MCY4317915.1 NAD(P)-dependent oxidoreductase [Alphaproteobacteria bacterium]